MVVIGDFSVRLVDATTKEAFTEHVGPDGKVFAEVEPGAEYFIELMGATEDKKKKLPQPLRVKYFVDGKDLGCRSNISGFPLIKSLAGLRSVSNGVATYTALCFGNPRITWDHNSPSQMSSSQMGNVTVKIHEKIENGTRNVTLNRTAVSVQAGTISADMTKGQKKKVLRSEKGSISMNEPMSRRKLEEILRGKKKTHKCGKLLDSITIYYCTALGLVQAGVFPGPDTASNRKRRSANDSDNNDATLVSTKKKRVLTEKSSTETTASAVVDLTSL